MGILLIAFTAIIHHNQYVKEELFITNKKFTIAAVAVAAITIAPVAASTVTSFAATSTSTTATAKMSTIGTFTVKNITASISTADGKDTGKHLSLNSKWKVFSAKKLGSELYYNVGGNQYVAAGLGVFTSNSGNNAAPAVTKISGVFTAGKTGSMMYSKEGVWSLADPLEYGSKWKVFGEMTLNGDLYYDLGGNQWVKATTGTLTGAKTNALAGTGYSKTMKLVKKTGKVTVKYVPGSGVQIWNRALKPLKNANGTLKKAKNGTSWKTFGYVFIDDELYYNLGGDQYIDGQYVSFK
ncbi:SLAP domain-containing protein [Lacticaseibacillus zhaodongensis]|uniref:SLAP domain-containing protein n=1 Tax=Lacticaseibacillus zhaodongensis TaxID=2668065 RepID=UPI0012D2BCBD|nr:SLAP domain-containing protein [Lacticaseibacillus zhaodongensis]